MANLSGPDGSLLLNGVTFSVTGWGYSGTIDKQEITTVGLNDKTYKQTTRDGSGSITFTHNPSDASQKVVIDFLKNGNTPAAILLQLYYDLTNTKQLYMSAVIDSIDLPEGANDVVTGTINYTKTGPLYHVTTT